MPNCSLTRSEERKFSRERDSYNATGVIVRPGVSHHYQPFAYKGKKLLTIDFLINILKKNLEAMRSPVDPASSDVRCLDVVAWPDVEI